MKKCVKDSLLVSFISLLGGIIIFLLFNLEVLSYTNTFIPFLYLSVISSTYVLTKLLKIKTKELEKDCYCYCGHVSALGASGIFILSFIFPLFNIFTTTLFHLFISLFFLFLVGMVGGIVCYLYSLNDCHNQECDTNCKHNDKNYNNENYVNNPYNRNNEYMYKERRR